MLFCVAVFQVVVSSYEAATSLIIEFDMDNNIFGLPREFVVASAGKPYTLTCVDFMHYVTRKKIYIIFVFWLL